MPAMALESITSLPPWESDNRTRLGDCFNHDFRPAQAFLNTGGERSSPFLPSLRAVDDARHAVVELARAMDTANKAGVRVRCVAFQDSSFAVVAHIVSVHRDTTSLPVIHLRYKLNPDGPAVNCPGSSLIKMKSGDALCVVSLSQRAQLVLLGVLDGNRYSGKFALPPSPLADMEPSYLACLQHKPSATTSSAPYASSRNSSLGSARNITTININNNVNNCPHCAFGVLAGSNRAECTECPARLFDDPNHATANSGWRTRLSWRSKTLRMWRRRRSQFNHNQYAPDSLNSHPNSIPEKPMPPPAPSSITSSFRSLSFFSFRPRMSDF